MTTKQELPQPASAALEALKSLNDFQELKGTSEYHPRVLGNFLWMHKETIRQALAQAAWLPIDENTPRDIPILGCVSANGCRDILTLENPVDWRYASFPDLWTPLPAAPVVKEGNNG
jgi:hypothetical protein